MEKTTKNRGTGWHLLARLVGLTGIVAASVGTVLWHQEGFAETGQLVTWIGSGMFALAAVVELLIVARLVLSRRGALGSNVILQVILALVLLAGINAFSFQNYHRFDCTLDQHFTLDTALQEELKKLRHETTLVVFQGHGSAGGGQSRDHYLAAADRKIVSKIRDLVEQFQDLGPSFHVEFLDIQDKAYPARLDALKEKSPRLVEAIQNAPENSVFFFTKNEPDGVERIQRLGFHDIYQLDRQTSQESKNLVLMDQGPGPFARKILNIEEKRPRIAVAATFETDSLDSTDTRYAMKGVKKALDLNGFDSRDIVLKQNEPVVLTYEETQFERLESLYSYFDRIITGLEKEIKEFAPLRSDFKTLSVAELNKKYALLPTFSGAKLIPRKELNELVIEYAKKGLKIKSYDISDEFKTDFLDDVEELLKGAHEDLERFKEKRTQTAKDKEKLNAEDLAEKRRLGDLREKFLRVLSDCDLVIVPRLTLVNIPSRELYSYQTYRQTQAQVEALKDFLKQGKPALFCLSPPQNEEDGKDDEVDKLLFDLGIFVSPETVLYDVDSEALAELRASPGLRRAQKEAPRVEIDWLKGSGLSRFQAKRAKGGIHPIRTSVRLGTGAGLDRPLDIRLRYPRPIYPLRILDLDIFLRSVGTFAAPGGYAPYLGTMSLAEGLERIDEKAILLQSGANAWNEVNPLPSEERIPQFERPKPEDPSRNTIRERRQGNFPIAAAVERTLPASWYPQDHKGTRARARVAVVGHGGIFIDETLNLAKEKFLFDTINWLLGREDLLARDNQSWRYPRVKLGSSAALWKWGAGLGLPLIFVYLGMVMWLVRRMR